MSQLTKSTCSHRWRCGCFRSHCSRHRRTYGSRRLRGERCGRSCSLCTEYKQLDGQGRVRREAARRRKSELKVNVAIPNSSRSNGSWQITPKTVSLSIMAYGLASAYSVRELQVGQHARYNVYVCGPKFITRLVVRIPPLASKWGTNTLNFRQNFKFSRSSFFFGGGTLIPIWACAIKTWSISSACINFRAQNRLGGWNIVSPQKFTWVAQF